MKSRLDYAESCRRLGLDPPPPIPERRPQVDDDEPLGVSFFRTFVEGDLSGLTLPRTLFGRSEIRGATFANTELSESTLCWNDFVDVDFSGTDLRRSDLRASQFENVSFEMADLRQADLRKSTFANCRFQGAKMAGAVLSRSQRRSLPLSLIQRLQIGWTGDVVEYPPS